jgi:hypothetical protein
VLENCVVVGRIFKVPVAPEGRPWMWASGLRRAAHGYEPMREATTGSPVRTASQCIVQQAHELPRPSLRINAAILTEQF